MVIEKFNEKYASLKEAFLKTIVDFDVFTETLGNPERNIIKIVHVEGKKYTIKSFKIPNVINQVVYRFIRKSKAQRSYEYAVLLTEKGIGTPDPVGYQLHHTPFTFKNSYYVSELTECDLTYRELTTDFAIPDHEEILRAFTRFTHVLHENNVNFLDHSPGNTLIKRVGKGYEFYLVDLNRMRFEKMNFETRIKNFAKLTIHKSMVQVMSNEYANCLGVEEKKVFDLMWRYTTEFQEKYYRKRRIKRRIFFWKKKYRKK